MLLWPLVQRRLSPMKEIGTLDVTQLINRANAVLLDVREPKEFEGGRLPNAVHIPLSQLARRSAELAKHDGAARRRVLRPRQLAAARRARHSRKRASTNIYQLQGGSARGRTPGCRWRSDHDPKPITMYHDCDVCPYCIQAERFLHAKGVDRHRRRSASTSTPRGATEMMERTGRRTVPQIYIGDRTSAATTTWWRSTAPASSRRCSPANGVTRRWQSARVPSSRRSLSRRVKSPVLPSVA